MLVTDAPAEELWLYGEWGGGVYRQTNGKWSMFCACGQWHTDVPPQRSRRRLATFEDWELLAGRYPMRRYKHLWKYCPDQIKEQLRASN